MIPIITQTNLLANNPFDAIQQLSEKLVSLQLVKDNFFEAVWHRELSFPTGLPIEGMGVAIPHTDPEHVNKTCFAIGRLVNSVNFFEMGNPDQTIPVELIIIIGVEKPENQLSVLKCILENLSRKNFIDAVRAAKDETDLQDLFIACLTEQIDANNLGNM